MLVGLYSGIKIHSLESQEAKDRRSPYRIDNDWAEAEQIIDIPADYRFVAFSSFTKDNSLKEITELAPFHLHPPLSIEDSHE